MHPTSDTAPCTSCIQHCTSTSVSTWKWASLTLPLGRDTGTVVAGRDESSIFLPAAR